MIFNNKCVFIWVFPKERRAEPPVTSRLQKVSKLSFWSQKMRNVLKRMQKTIFRFIIIFSFRKIFSSSFWNIKEIFRLKMVDEKFGFAPVSFKL